MESLLTLSIGDFRAVELSLRLAVALISMTALLMLLSTTCTAARYRFPLILSGVALLGTAWFESGVWMAWKEAFELAGTSYCVTGHLLASEDRILAWSLGVPAILFALGLVKYSHEKAGTNHVQVLGIGCLLLAVGTPFSRMLGLILFVVASFYLALRISRSSPWRIFIVSALVCMAVGILVPAIGSLYSPPGDAGRVLVRGEILRALIDLLSLMVPGVILLIGALRLPEQESAD